MCFVIVQEHVPLSFFLGGETEQNIENTNKQTKNKIKKNLTKTKTTTQAKE